MNIRSLIGLTALTPYIIGSSFLIATACAPKSRFRGPVNVAGLGPISKVATAQVDADTQARIKEISDALAKNPKLKAETDKFNADFGDIDVDIKNNTLEVSVTYKNDKKTFESMKFSGPVIKGEESDLSNGNSNTLTTPTESYDVSASAVCINDDCSVVDINLKKESAAINKENLPVISFRATKSVTSAVAEVMQQKEDDKEISESLLKIEEAQRILVLNLINSKETTFFSVVSGSKELIIKASSETIKAAQNASDLQSNKTAFEIIKNDGFSKITSAKITSHKVDSTKESMIITLSDLNSLAEGSNTVSFVAGLTLGADATDVLAKRTEEGKPKTEEDKAADDIINQFAPTNVPVNAVVKPAAIQNTTSKAPTAVIPAAGASDDSDAIVNPETANPQTAAPKQPSNSAPAEIVI